MCACVFVHFSYYDCGCPYLCTLYPLIKAILLNRDETFILNVLCNIITGLSLCKIVFFSNWCSEQKDDKKLKRKKYTTFALTFQCTASVQMAARKRQCERLRRRAEMMDGGARARARAIYQRHSRCNLCSEQGANDEIWRPRRRARGL